MGDASPVSQRETGEAAPPVLQFVDVAKTFGAVQALKGVSFDVRPGEVHALLGHNGAGKSTLVKILAGVHGRDTGQVLLDGDEQDFRDPLDARKAGINVVYQELSLVPALSVAANLMLGEEPRNRLGFVRRRQLHEEAARLCTEWDLPFDTRTPVERLGHGYRQSLEIARALGLRGGRVIVFDEPTSSLSPAEEEQFFSTIESLRERGVAIIYITHRLAEVFRLADRVTILRDGRSEGTFPVAEVDLPSLVTRILGRDLETVETAADPADSRRAAGRVELAAADEEPVLALTDVVTDKLRGVSLELRRGEIVGLAGMLGSGRTEILRAAFGVDRIKSGEISVDGKPVKLRDPLDAIRHGLALVPEDRREQGLVLEHSIQRNVLLPRLDSLASRLRLLRRRTLATRAAKALEGLDLPKRALSAAVGTLSGGNQQKVVFAKWLAGDKLRALFLDEPTNGVDVGARQEIHRIMLDVAGEGAPVVLVSSEFADLLALCDRIGVVADGRIVRWLARGECQDEVELHRIVQGGDQQ
jgi:ribose transport system ATP-binding protein